MIEKLKPTHKWVIGGFLVALVVSLLSLSLYHNFKSHREYLKLVKTKEQIEANFKTIDTLVARQDGVLITLDSIEPEVKEALKSYKELIEKNHYENDSVLTYINNVHIDSLWARLPEPRREP